ncbi:MAG: hypothetical protein OER95_11795 [Acidimicrobiia bacterium]|nr:hypothetical protein [Acidimicrobiia bacterium]
MSTLNGHQRTPLFVAVLAAIALLAAACGTANTTTVAPSPVDDATNASTEAAASGESAKADESDEQRAAPEAAGVVLPTVSGGQIDFGSLDGTDAILWYWAPW